MKRLGLIPEWRKCWRFWSVQLGALFALAATLYSELDELREILPPTTFAKVSAVLAVIAIIARILKQKG